MYKIEELSNEINAFILSKSEKISLVFLDIDDSSKHIYINEKAVFPSASTIKVLIMAKALEAVIEKKHSLNEKVIVNESDKVPYSIVTCLHSDTYLYIDLITLMIISSDNTATNILIDILGMENICEYAVKIGLTNTFLRRKMMDSEAVNRGTENVTSALDMLMLFNKINCSKILNKNMCDLIIKILSQNMDTEVLLRYLPDNVNCGHKTGDVKNINHDIGIFNINNNKYILGIFVRGGNFSYISKHIIGKISKIIYDYVTA